MFTIVYTERADLHLSGLRAFDQARIVDEIDDQLMYSPTASTSRKKILKAVIPAFEYVPPVRQLRVDAFRVIYDVDTRSRVVTIRAVLYKGNKATQEIL